MSFLSAVKGELGSQSNPISSLSEIDNNEFTGFEPLFTDFGGRLNNPIQVDVLFGESGGPWIPISFDFGSEGSASLNNTHASQGNDKSDYGNLNFPSISQDRRMEKHYAPVGSGLEGEWGTANGDEDNPRTNLGNAYLEPSYRRHNNGSTSLLDSTEEEAVRDWVQLLSDSTPHMCSSEDADGASGESVQRYDQVTDIPTNHNEGHYVFYSDVADLLNDKSSVGTSNTISLHTEFADRSAENDAMTWSSTSHEYDNTQGGGNLSPESKSPGSTAGINDVNTKLILPRSVALIQASGHGPHTGTPYSTSLNSGDNQRNNRLFFLIRD